LNRPVVAQLFGGVFEFDASDSVEWLEEKDALENVHGAKPVRVAADDVRELVRNQRPLLVFIEVGKGFAGYADLTRRQDRRTRNPASSSQFDIIDFARIRQRPQLRIHRTRKDTPSPPQPFD